MEQTDRDENEFQGMLRIVAANLEPRTKEWFTSTEGMEKSTFVRAESDRTAAKALLENIKALKAVPVNEPLPPQQIDPFEALLKIMDPKHAKGDITATDPYEFYTRQLDLSSDVTERSFDARWKQLKQAKEAIKEQQRAAGGEQGAVDRLLSGIREKIRRR